MRRIIALLLTVVMALSLVVVAGAAETGKTVNLRIEPAMKDEAANGKTELTYYVYLKPQGDAEVGAAQFTLTAPAGTTFKSVKFNTEYVYDGSSANPVVGSDKGIFAKGAITSDPDSGDFGGQLESDKRSFKAILAGTVRGERMLTAGNSEKCLYEVTLEVPAFDGKTNYTIGVKDATAGYNGDSNETGSVNDLTMRHTVNVSSKGYGGMLGDLNGDNVVNSDDLTALARIIAGIDVLNSQTTVSADVTKNGTVDSDDLTMMARYIAGIIVSFD